MWMVYERVSGPLGPQRGDLHAAQISLGIYNANRGKKGKKLKLSDFVLKFYEEQRDRRRGRGELTSGDEDIEAED